MTKPKRFILIDPSIKAPGGHHYEYAERILNAARDNGFETLLLAHKDYKGTVSHRVAPVFSKTFWDQYRYYYTGATKPETDVLCTALKKPAKHVIHSINNIVLSMKRHFIFSKYGLAVARARHLTLRTIIFRPYLPDDASFNPTPRGLLALMRIGLGAAAIAKIGIDLVSRPAVKRALKAGLLVLTSPLLSLAALYWLYRSGSQDPSQQFAKELIDAFNKDHDFTTSILFIPNATAAELDGLVWLDRAKHPSRQGHWSILYRRPVFSGYPAGYKNQIEQARLFKMEFARLKDRAPHLNVIFYTDTQELTDQYNRLGIFNFSTLPVPVDLVAAKPPATAPKLTMGYLGDARDEKGYPLLPRIVEACAARANLYSEICFLFQSNFNVPGGEQGSAYAHGLLKQYGDAQVELVYGPFDSAAYQALLHRMDIVLIPYNSLNYSARSSGVLMEALSLGLPVLVPAGSWMAGLMEPARRQHILTILHEHKPVAAIEVPFETINDKILEIDPSANYLFIRIKFMTQVDSYIRIVFTSINKFDVTLDTYQMTFKIIDDEVIALMPKKPSEQLWWKAEPVAPDSDVNPISVTMNLFTLNAAVPLSCGSALFDRDDDVPLAIDDLLNHYEHHKRGADQLRDTLRPFYDPHVLVKTLARNALPTDAQQQASLSVAAEGTRP